MIVDIMMEGVTSTLGGIICRVLILNGGRLHAYNNGMSMINIFLAVLDNYAIMVGYLPINRNCWGGCLLFADGT